MRGGSVLHFAQGSKSPLRLTRVFLKVLPTAPNLLEGDGDIAIQFEEPSASNIVSRQLGWLHYILYATPGYLKRFGEPKEMADLRKHQCLRLSGKEYQPASWRPGWPTTPRTS